MSEEVDFLYDHQLVAAIEKLIQRSEKQLLLVSPFIDLDDKIRAALSTKLDSPKFKLYVLFGKNKGDFKRSLKSDSLEFLKRFPNVEIRYNEHLHAKFYLNDSHYILTTMNLYCYSLNNNIEMGVQAQYSSNGLLGKAIDNTALVIINAIESGVRQDLLGYEKQVHPVQKIWQIFNDSSLQYRTEPTFSENASFLGLVVSKKISGRNIVEDNLTAAFPNAVNPMTHPSASGVATAKKEIVLLSASVLGKNFGLKAKEVSEIMQGLGLISDGSITEKGREHGLKKRNYKGVEYIAYPETLSEYLL